jgi:hypothetical protein
VVSLKPVLPRKATLNASRVRFLLSLQPLPGFNRTYVLFDSNGGELRRHDRRSAGAVFLPADKAGNTPQFDLGISSNG